MTDSTPAPSPELAPGPATLSVEQILALEQQLRENKAAQLRGDPQPHTVTDQQLRDAINGIRRQRGTLGIAGEKKASKGKAASAGPTIQLLDLDGL